MNFNLENLGVLFGLFALTVPIVLHLLRRRRHEVMDWGAMQFLPERTTSHKRRWLDEILLLLTRLGMITLVVLALATPVSTSSWLAPLQGRSRRDVVLVFDGSYSMNLQVPTQTSPWTKAIQWAHTCLDRAPDGSRFSIVIARQPPLLWMEEFSGDLEEVRAKLNALPSPCGNPDMPRSLITAWRHLQTRSKAGKKEIIVLTDQQHFGWADETTLAALSDLGDQWHKETQQAHTSGIAVPSLRVVKVADELPTSLPNYSLAPLTTARSVAVIGQNIAFQSALHLAGVSRSDRFPRIRLIVDGQKAAYLSLPAKAELKQGQIPLRFGHRFAQEGPHLVSLRLETDGLDDVLPTDNEQHCVVEVVKELPILLVDGDKELSSASSTYFLQRALATKQSTASVPAVPASALRPTQIFPDSPTAIKPAVIVLADVPRLDAEQMAALDRFLSDGGGLLIAVGERAAGEKKFYDEQLYREGQGWLPVQLGEIGAADEGVHPEPRTFQHAALEPFRTATDNGMNLVRFAKWSKARWVPRGANPIARLSNDDPFLFEKPYKQGRVILCMVPLDQRWKSTWPNEPEFPVLVRALVDYLAGSQTASTILQHGASIRLAPNDAKGRHLTVRTPEGPPKFLDVLSWPWTFENTGTIGVYQVVGFGEQTLTFVVPPDLRESQLARCGETDWLKITERLPIVWQKEPSATEETTEARREEMWWLLLLGVLGLLCVEVWMTRRMVLARGM